MKSLKSLIQPIVFNGGKNIYVVGLSLENGNINKVKIYNKIYDKNLIYNDYLNKFGGQACLNAYNNTNEWKNLHPGFSGFTIGVEIDKNNEYKYGFGYKDKKENQIFFECFYLNKDKNIIAKEKYLYIESEKATINNKMQTKIIEIKENNFNCYCYCPEINLKNIKEIENKIELSISQINHKFFKLIKKYSHEFCILNYGVNENEEKIYILSKNDPQNVDNVLSLLEYLKFQA